MANTVNFNNASPAAPASYVNVTWQVTLASKLVSGYVPNALSLDADTSISSPAAGDILSYNASISKWVNKQPFLSADADVQISSPQDGQVLTYVAANSNWENKTPSSAGPGTTLTTDLGLRWQANPVPGNSFAAGAFFGSATGWGSLGTIASASIAGANPPGNLSTTSASAGSSTGHSFPGGSVASNSPFSLATLNSCVIVVKLSQITNMRIWIGLGSIGGSGGGTQALAWRTDTPGSSFAVAAFRYSTAASDSKYQCVTGSGSAQTATPESTSSHVDATTIHVFMIRYVAPNVVFYIDGVQVGSQSTNAPSTSTGLFPQVWLDNVGLANAEAFTMYGARGQWAGV